MVYIILWTEIEDDNHEYNTRKVGMYNKLEEVIEEMERILEEITNKMDIYRYCIKNEVKKETGIKEVDEKLQEGWSKAFSWNWGDDWGLMRKVEKEICDGYGKDVFNGVKKEIMEDMLRDIMENMEKRTICEKEYHYNEHRREIYGEISGDKYGETSGEIYVLRLKMNKMIEIGYDEDEYDNDEDEYDNEINKLKAEREKLKEEIEHLKYKPGGIGYKEAKKEFEELSGK